MTAFAIAIPQFRSLLSSQKRLVTWRQGKSNARALFGIEWIARDNRMRGVLEGTPRANEHYLVENRADLVTLAAGRLRQRQVLYVLQSRDPKPLRAQAVER